MCGATFDILTATATTTIADLCERYRGEEASGRREPHSLPQASLPISSGVGGVQEIRIPVGPSWTAVRLVGAEATGEGGNSKYLYKMDLHFNKLQIYLFYGHSCSM